MRKKIGRAKKISCERDEHGDERGATNGGRGGGAPPGTSGASAATATKESVEFLDLSRYFESSGDHFYLGER